MKICVVGAGNVATHLCRALAEAGVDVAVAASRPGQSAKSLAQCIGIKALDSVADIALDTDLVIISTTDATVASASAQIPMIQGIVVHTSGSVPIDALSRHSRRAVLYPLQTFSKDTKVDMRRVPFFTEASDQHTLTAIDSIAALLSDNVRHADSSVRRNLHLAGVLACNFPVYLLEITRRVLDEVGLPLDTVQPLVEVTMEKAFNIGPLAAMTGPARRGDTQVIERQAQLLPEGTDRDIYKLLSKAILHTFHPEK